MPKYEIEDPKTGLKLELEGDRPPTEQEIADAMNNAYNVKFPGETTTPQPNTGLTPSGTVSVNFTPAYIPPPPEPAPEILREGARGFFGAPSKAQVLSEKAAYKAGEMGLQAMLSTAGQGLGGMVGPQAAAAAGAGAGLGTAIQEGARALAKRAGYEAAAPKSLGDAAGKVAAEAATTAAGSYLIPKAVQVGMAGTREVVKRGAGVISGVTGDAFERIMARPKEVLKQIADGPVEKAKEYADAFKVAIEANFEKAGEKYDELIKTALTQKMARGHRFDLLKGLGSDLAEIQKKYGFGLPNRVGDADEAAQFLQVNRLIQGSKNATAEDLYYLQRDLGRMARAKRGTPLGSALSEIDQKVNQYIATRIPAVRKANEIYAPAKEMMVMLEKQIGKIDDLPGKISSAFRRNTEFKNAIEKVADAIPAAREALESLFDAQAARPFEPRLAPLPRTGLAAGVGLGAAKVLSSPATMAAGAVTAPFLFPRTLAQLLAAGSRVAPVVTEASRKAAPAASTGLADWLLRRQQPAR